MEQFSLTDIKKKNLSDVYHYIYMNPSCSKQDIATALSVSLPTVSQHLTTLESEQLIEKCGRLSSSVGRRANAYHYFRCKNRNRTGNSATYYTHSFYQLIW